jgi:hypothetical protein
MLFYWTYITLLVPRKIHTLTIWIHCYIFYIILTYFWYIILPFHITPKIIQMLLIPQKLYQSTSCFTTKMWNRLPYPLLHCLYICIIKIPSLRKQISLWYMLRFVLYWFVIGKCLDVGLYSIQGRK